MAVATLPTNALLIDVHEVASRLGCSESTVWRMEKNRLMPPRVTAFGRLARWRQLEIESWVSNGCLACSNEA